MISSSLLFVRFLCHHFHLDKSASYDVEPVVVVVVARLVVGVVEVVVVFFLLLLRIVDTHFTTSRFLSTKF